MLSNTTASTRGESATIRLFRRSRSRTRVCGPVCTIWSGICSPSRFSTGRSPTARARKKRPTDTDPAGEWTRRYVLYRVSDAEKAERTEIVGRWDVERVTYDGDADRGSRVFGMNQFEFDKTTFAGRYQGNQQIFNKTPYVVAVNRPFNWIDLMGKGEALGGRDGWPKHVYSKLPRHLQDRRRYAHMALRRAGRQRPKHRPPNRLHALQTRRTARPCRAQAR